MGSTPYLLVKNVVFGVLAAVAFGVSLVAGLVAGIRPAAWTEDGELIVRTRRQVVRFRPTDVEAWGVHPKGQIPLVIVRLRDATEIDVWGAEPLPLIEILERAGVPWERLRGGYWGRLVRRLPPSA